jgi:hypothetical protein
MIYRHVAHGAKVRFRPDKRLSTCGALLVSCRKIHDEFLPIFHGDFRSNFSDHFDKKTGTVLLPRSRLDALSMSLWRWMSSPAKEE